MCWERRIVEANAARLKIVAPGQSPFTLIYRHVDCGHEQEHEIASVRRNKITCGQCIEAGLRDEAKAAGLALLGPVILQAEVLAEGITFIGQDFPRFRHYRFLSCGHEANLHTEQVRKKEVKCDLCQPRSSVPF